VGCDTGTKTGGGAGGATAGRGVGAGAGGGGASVLTSKAKTCGLGAFGPDKICVSNWFIVWPVGGATPGGGAMGPPGAGGGATSGGAAFKALRPSAGPAF